MARLRTFPCESCGADLGWDASEAVLACPYCGVERRLGGGDPAEERDLVAVLQRRAAWRSEETAPQARAEGRCRSCGATVVFEGTLTASHCAWCGEPVQRDDAHAAESRIPVDAVLPFALEADPVRARVGRWLRGLWFAPNAFARLAVPERLQGVYLPYWTFDALTESRYRGRRGDRERVRRGSKTEVRVRWSPASGRFAQAFDDVAVVAHRGLPRRMRRRARGRRRRRVVGADVAHGAGILPAFARAFRRAGGERRQDVPFHHVAIATRDTKANHDFYTRAMGFRLVKVQAGPSPEGGWSKHLFYDTGGEGMIAFWELHGPGVPEQWSPAIAEGLGLPVWSNHLAFAAPDRAALDAARDRWLACGHDALEIDHDWCVSIYTKDPNGILVEWCLTVRAFTDADVREAEQRLASARPDFDPAPRQTLHRARKA